MSLPNQTPPHQTPPHQTAPRKTPRQERSRAMVRRILDAGERTLIDHGYDGASTNRIAAAAGISPGSLYQYFPNKDAIVAAVIARYSEAFASRVAQRLVGQLDQPARVVARNTLATLLDALDVHPRFLRAVIEQTPRLDGPGRLTAFEQRIGELITAYLMLHRDTVRADIPLDTAAWILVRMVEHLTVRYILDRPPIPRERFLDELTRLALNYLRPAARREAPDEPAAGRGAPDEPATGREAPDEPAAGRGAPDEPSAPGGQRAPGVASSSP